MKPPTDHEPTAEQIVLAPREQIIPSPLNPRKTFPDEYLGELGLNIRNNGLINALVVREIEYQIVEPHITNSWHLHWRSHPSAEWRPLFHLTAIPEPAATKLMLTREDCEAHLLTLPRYELVAGECRWRATGERAHPEQPKLTMAALTHLPIIVRELNDAVVLELMLSENMKRRDLSPLEEMDAFARMLQQRDAEGQPVHSARSLADKIGVSESYVRQRLSLHKLTEHGRKALAAGTISFFTARNLCTCPEVIVPLVEDEVLQPEKYDHWRDQDGPLTAEETMEVIREKYVRDLRGSPFELTNANLVPVHTKESGERIEGGACVDCPWNTANQETEVGSQESAGKKRGRGRPTGDNKFCLNPACYQKKVDVHVAAELVRAKEQGCRVLSEKEAERAVNAHGSLTYNSPFVKLEEKPDATDRAHAVEEKKCPTWEKIVMGVAQPEVVIAVDKRGHVHRLVERKVAIAAARKNGTEKYLSLGSGRGRSAQDEDYEEQRKKEAARGKLRAAQGRAVLEALVNGFQRACLGAESGLREEFWRAFLATSVRHAGHAGCTLAAKHLAIEVPKDKTVASAVEAYGRTLTGVSLAGFNFELLLAQDFSYADSPHNIGDVCPESAKPLLKLFGIDSGAIKKQVEKEAAAKRKAGDAKKEATKAASRKDRKGAKAPVVIDDTPISPENFVYFAKLDEMKKAGEEITPVKVQSKFKLAGLQSAGLLIGMWEKRRAAQAASPAKAGKSKAATPTGSSLAAGAKMGKAAERKKGGLSPEARAKIMAAQKARWAKSGRKVAAKQTPQEVKI